MLAKALAKECDACFILLKSSTILRQAAIPTACLNCDVRAGLRLQLHPCCYGSVVALLPALPRPLRLWRLACLQAM